MTPATLSTIGSALYGARWQSDLARDLGVADRTVRRWVAGTAAIPPALHSDLIALLDARSATISRLRAIIST